MKKRISLLLAAALCFAVQTAAQAKEIPQPLWFEAGAEQTQELDEVRRLITFAPVTSRPDVNAELDELMKQMTDKAMPVLLASELADDWSSIPLRIGTAVSRTSTKWMSFLTTANIDAAERYIDHDARVYDMETGARLTFSDVIALSPEATNALGAALYDGISAYFPELAPDEDALNAALDHIDSLPFTLSPGTLRFHLRADEFYPGKDTLLTIKLPYADIRPYLTEQAAVETDCSEYSLIALTFDDGPAGNSTIAAVNLLKQYGADGTFFMVGSRFEANRFALKYVNDGGFALGNHSYNHYTRYLSPSEVRAEMDAFQAAMFGMIGASAALMRAPGGYEKPYVSAKVDLPLIHWTVASGDGTSTRGYKERDIVEIYNQVIGGAQDGAVVLFHDLRKECPLYLTPILEYLEENNFLCVSVEELFSIRGEELKPSEVYYGLCLDE